MPYSTFSLIDPRPRRHGRHGWWWFNALAAVALLAITAAGTAGCGGGRDQRAVVAPSASAPTPGREAAPVDRPGEVATHRLPPQALDTLKLIQSRGPFPYRKDGTTFQNREKRLPVKARGYYTEYTVKTPGRGDRGARRIVAGKGATGDPATSGEYWYTDDHYESFRRIVNVSNPK